MDEEKQIAKIISDNIAFRLTIALASPKAYEKNRDDLAAILAKEIVKRPRLPQHGGD